MYWSTLHAAFFASPPVSASSDVSITPLIFSAWIDSLIFPMKNRRKYHSDVYGGVEILEATLLWRRVWGEAIVKGLLNYIIPFFVRIIHRRHPRCARQRKICIASRGVFFSFVFHSTADSCFPLPMSGGFRCIPKIAIILRGEFNCAVLLQHAERKCFCKE